MSDILKLAYVLEEELGEKVLWLEGFIRAGGREYHWDMYGQIVQVKKVKS